ncbi:MmgE/PrpD family protein [Nocardioides sp. cx-173]|uniref:MmgE/PrpD family protein n=1 Tax=Nocardioides sp. cx-173 TaxID=2898796 RepID=UPI001E498AA9|nr:MmgE/PrpD family protein [Nocardioides sp. cx-173]MCD4524251.1 MmgE/PrpD family protein [Nocardioides sp. cx-173]UGB41643.1 MmgE/PrpD family protein [Nocardioides sp. cx-173]
MQRPYEETGLTARLARFVVDTTYDDIPAEVVEYAKVMLTDALGVAFGASVLEDTRRFVTVAEAMGGPEQATILTTGTRVSAPAAAWANGYLAQALDADDTYYSNGHPLASIAGALMAAGEEVGASGKELITALVVGYDVSIRCRRSFYQAPNGYSSSFGAFVMGAAAAVAKLYRLNVEQTAITFGTASFTSPGQGIRWGAMSLGERHAMKYWPNLSQAFAAVTSGQLARAGVTGDRTVFEGTPSFAMLLGYGGIDEQLMFEDLGTRWFINETSIKPWAVCKYPMITMTQVRELMQEEGLTAEDIDAVHVQTWDFLAGPYTTEFTELTDEYDAQISFRHAVAATVLGWEMGPDWQARAVGNSQLNDLAQKVTVVPNPTYREDSTFTPEGNRAMATVITVGAGGKEYVRRASSALGDGFDERYRYDFAMVREKFLDYAKHSLTGEQMERILANLEHLETLEDVRFQLTA